MLLILAGVGLYYIFREEGVLDQARKAKFLTEYTEVDEASKIYHGEKFMDSISGEEIEISLPVGKKLTASEKKEIETNNPTLAMTIKLIKGGSSVSSAQMLASKEESKRNTEREYVTSRAGGKGKNNIIEQANLYWIDQGLIKVKKDHRYIIDIDTHQIYDYEGQYFFRKMWHVPEIGIDIDTLESTVIKEEENVTWDGWITLQLYYPNDAVEKMWRISEEGETRYDENLEWEEYTGSITVRLSQVENIWIKYKIEGKEVIIPPKGQLLVDIEVEPKGGEQEEVTVKINYDENAQTKKYRVNGEEWKDYEGEFKIAENVLIEAKGTKIENVYNEEGEIIASKVITGKDAYFIRNIKTTTTVDESLESPTITYTKGENGKVTVTVNYPSNVSTDSTTKKWISINHGPKKEYTGPIEINEGDTVTVWYETSRGTTSKYVSGSNSSNTKEYVPYEYGSTNIPQSSESIAGPIINVSLGEGKATIKLTTQKPARKIYIQLGNNAYEEYTDPITVKDNMVVRAYYITEEEGARSKTTYGRVSGISKGGKPVVTIDAEPYPYGDNKIVDKVTVTITTDAERVEYSYDGVVYKEYTKEIEITKNCRIYARASNGNGTTVEYLDITNLSNEPSAKKEILNVSIAVTPEPNLSVRKVNKVTVNISYDTKATGKYYTIGKYGELQEYKGPFEITNNCTIYAYATSDKGSGQTSKMIDNLLSGISEPMIIATPGNEETTTKTKISIKYDREAKIKRYEIDGNGLYDYIEEFEVEKNCTIRAVNVNSEGESAESTYKVTNIAAAPVPLILDKGDYYLLKLPFPKTASVKEYKLAEEEWKTYPEDGIILIKPEKKEDVIKNEKVAIKIEDENGERKDFKGDWYILDCPINEFTANIKMRWNRIQEDKPEIILSTQEPARKVKVTIKYTSGIIKKQYKIVEPDGKQGGWKEYKEGFEISKKGTIIYARGYDEAEVYSKEAMVQINNIDEEAPVIKLSADTEKLQQKVVIKVVVTDDTEVNVVKWDKGNLGESYFISEGRGIPNNSTVTVTENGIYTFYARDSVGNTQIYTLTIGNIDLEAPDITITSSPTTIGTEAKVTIDYGDAVTKQYKIGSTGTWKNYTGEITLTSYDVISAKVVNEDYTVTIYARGVDSVGNETIVDEKLYNLDLDAPTTPTITAKSGYPILTEYGVVLDDEVTIKYDTGKDIKNYYSTNGTDWEEYTGAFKVSSGTIYAKSVKVGTGLEVTTSKTVTIPSDALGLAAYDGNDGTYYSYSGTRKLYVDDQMQGKNFSMTFTLGATQYETCYLKIYFYNESGELVSSATKSYSYTTTHSNPMYYSTYTNQIINIPQGISYIQLNASNGSGTSSIVVRLTEIKVANEPVITGKQYYPIVTEYGVQPGYCTATISYDNTAVQRFYKIDDGAWQTYQNKEIRLEIGQILYAKGLNKKGEETRVTSSYTASLLSDSIGTETYDGNMSTKQNFTGTRKVLVSEEMQGKAIAVKMSVYADRLNTYTLTVTCYDKNSEKLGTSISTSGKGQYTSPQEEKGVTTQILNIPEGTTEIRFTHGNSSRSSNVYEIVISNEPRIQGIQYYPILTKNGVDTYSTAIISYDSTSIQRLYKIDDSEWKKYNEPVRLGIGEVLYAKGIDKNGNETRITSSYTATLPGDALGLAAYDGNSGTRYTLTGTKKIVVSEEMQGKAINVRMSVNVDRLNTYTLTISCYNESSEKLGTSISTSGKGNYTSTQEEKGLTTKTLNIPEGTTEIRFTHGNSSRSSNVYEITIPEQ